MRKGGLFIGCLIFLIQVTSCKKDKPKDKQDTSFDKKEMLISFSDKVIIPSLNDLMASTENLSTQTAKFADNPTAANLDSLRASWKATHVAFLYCHSFNYGPGEKPIIGMMAENIGIWPANTVRIEERIQTNNTNFTADFERDTRGFMALDYLLYENNSANSLINGTEPNRMNYLLAVVEHIRSWVSGVHSGWTTGGYRTTFINNDGKDVGSSIGMIYNEFLKSYEAIKNFKLGLPAGKRAGQTQTEPTRVEAYYSGLSNYFIKEHLKAVENLWRGRSKLGEDGIGFDDWLASLKDGANLKTTTEQRFAILAEETAKLGNDERLSDLIINDLNRVELLYEEYAETTRFIKSDLSSLIGIAITFSSGDGD